MCRVGKRSVRNEASYRLSTIPYCSHTLFIRTEFVGWSLKFCTFLEAGDTTIEWAIGMTGHSSNMSCCAFL